MDWEGGGYRRLAAWRMLKGEQAKNTGERGKPGGRRGRRVRGRRGKGRRTGKERSGQDGKWTEWKGKREKGWRRPGTRRKEMEKEKTSYGGQNEKRKGLGTENGAAKMEELGSVSSNVK